MLSNESFFSALIALLVAIIFWSILIIPARAPIAFIIGLLTFFVYRHIVLSRRELKCTISCLRFKKVLITSTILLSILAVIFIPQFGENIEFASWNDIPILNLLRLVLSSILLFFPGYVLLHLIDKKEHLSKKERIFFSFLIALFLLPFLGVLSFAVGSNLVTFGVFLIILLNLFSLTLYILKLNIRNNVSKLSFDLNQTAVILLLVVLMIVIMLNKYFMNIGWDYGDLNCYFGFAVSFTKSTYPVGVLGMGQMYPFWFTLFVAQSLVLGGIPYINSFQFALIPMTVFPILSFYVFVCAFFENSHYKIPAIATILGFFGAGFGWLYGSSLLSSNLQVTDIFKLFIIAAKTDSGYLSLPLYPVYTLIPYFISLGTIFALMWLIYSERANVIGNIRYILVFISITLGYLTHVADTVIFILFFLFSIVFIRREDLIYYRNNAISIFLGLLLVAVPDLLLHSSTYLGMQIFNMPFYIGVLIVSLSAIMISVIRIRFGLLSFEYIFSRLKIKLTSDKVRALKLFGSVFIIYLYFLSLIILTIVYLEYGSIPIFSHTVPWYAWANRLGICGLMALPGIILIIWRNTWFIRKFPFFAFSAVLFLLIAGLIHLFPAYYEDRLTFYILIPAIVVSSHLILEFYNFLRKHLKRIALRNLLFGLVLSVIMILGFFAPLLVETAIDANYWSQPTSGEGVSELEVDGLNFLRLSVPSNASVLTITARSQYLLSYAGLTEVQTNVNKHSHTVFGESSPETVFYILYQFQVKYVFLSSFDKDVLSCDLTYSGFIKEFLLKYLPVVFENSCVTIYQIPEFSPPTESTTALLVPAVSTGYFKDVFSQSNEQHLRNSSILAANDCLTVMTDNQRKNHDVEFPLNINPAEYNCLTIKWKTDGSRLYLFLLSSAKVYSILLGSSTQWQKSVINLDEFYDFSLNKTTGIGSTEQLISITFRNFEADSEYSLDYIRFSSQKFFQEYSSALSTLAFAQLEYSVISEEDPARFNFSTLILTHDLDRRNALEEISYQRYLQWVAEGGHLIVMTGTESPFDFSKENLVYSLELNSQNLAKEWAPLRSLVQSLDESSIIVQTSSEDKHHDLFSPLINLTVALYPNMVIRWKTDGSPLYIYLNGSQSGFRYVRLGSSTQWVTSIINLKNFYDFTLKNNTSFKDAEQIEQFVFRCFNENASYAVESIKFYSVYPLPAYPAFFNLLSLTVNGTSDANGIVGLTSGNFSTISVPLLQSGGSNLIIANYTLIDGGMSPYIVSQKNGDGEITYLEVAPLFSQFNSAQLDIQTLSSYFGSLALIPDLELRTYDVKWFEYFPQFDFIRGSANITGNIHVETGYLQMPVLDLDNITILSVSVQNETMHLSDSTFQFLYDKPIKFSIDASKLNLLEVGSGGYLMLTIVGAFDITMKIPKNDLVTISLVINGSSIDKILNDDLIRLHFKDDSKISLFVKRPTITVNGSVFFENARIYRSNYSMPLFYDDGSASFNATGNVSFTITYSGDSINLLDNFRFSGTWSTLSNTQNSSFDVSLFSIFASPYHILLMLCIVVSIMLITLINRKKSRFRL